MLNPAEKRRVVDRDAALAHHFLEVKGADTLLAIPTNAQQDHFGREAAACEIEHGGT